MSEHRIRFRGAWDWRGFEGGSEVGRRVTLPADWPDDVRGRFSLHRRFGLPPINPDFESARLELAGVPGLSSARLNGRDLGEIPPGVTEWEIPLAGVLLPRNALVLEIELPEGPGARKGWGIVALIIATQP